MSNGFASSETTPLRRPDSSASNNTVFSATRINVNNNNTISNNNNNNHHHIDIDDDDRTGHSNCDNNSDMDTTNQRIWRRIVIDVFILLIVGFSILFFFIFGEPYKRGFYCDDESIRYPFHESTVKNWMLYIIGLMLPIAIIVLTEIFQAQRNQLGPKRTYKILDYSVPSWAVEVYKQIGVFGFGAAATQLFVDVAKYSIGRLRPHFIQVCQPVMPGGTTCADPINQGRYIEDFTCQGVDSSPRMLKEMRLSFPSGHSSFSTFTMVYIAIFLQSRMTWRGSKLLKHFLQSILVMIAWYTALSRVSNYKHHWSDVLAGATIGVVGATVVAKYMSDLFTAKLVKPYLLPTTNAQTELAPPPVTANGHRA